MNRLRELAARMSLAVLAAGFAGASLAGHDAPPAACSANPNAGFTAPIKGTLPVPPWASSRELAALALPYAMMAQDVRDRDSDRLAEFGFYRGPDSNDLLAASGRIAAAVSGFYATTFFHCRQNAIVIVIRSTTPTNLRDWFAGFFRQSFGGESALAVSLFDIVREHYPHHWISLAGHSSAGGLTSYLGGRRNVPSIVFSPVRTEAALSNLGDQQLIVMMVGDVLADPIADLPPGPMGIVGRIADEAREIRGLLLKIEPTDDYTVLQLHWIDVIVDELGRIVN